MAPVVVFAAIAAVIGVAFGLAVLNQYRSRRKPYQAVWGAALLMFGIAALCEAIGLAAGWSAGDYKAYYLFGALLNVGWLAVGEVYLLAPRAGGRAAAIVMLVVTVISVVVVVAAGANAAQLRAQFPDDRKTLDVPAVLPAVTNSLASVILVLGAAWSAWKAYRRTAPAGLVAGTVLIAAGAFVIAAFHGGAVVGHAPALRPISEAVGIAIMFAGYLVLEAERPTFQPRTA
jgi:hypothetical protein